MPVVQMTHLSFQTTQMAHLRLEQCVCHSNGAFVVSNDTFDVFDMFRTMQMTTVRLTAHFHFILVYVML